MWDEPLCTKVSLVKNRCSGRHDASTRATNLPIQQCTEGNRNLAGIHDVWLPKALESLNPVCAAKYFVSQGEGLAKSLPSFGHTEAAHCSDIHLDPSESQEEPAMPPDRLSKMPCGKETSPEHSSDGDPEAWETDRDLEPWEIIRDALLSWQGPERPLIDEWRRLLCRKTFIMRWMRSCRGDGALLSHEFSFLSLRYHVHVCELSTFAISDHVNYLQSIVNQVHAHDSKFVHPLFSLVIHTQEKSAPVYVCRVPCIIIPDKTCSANSQKRACCAEFLNLRQLHYPLMHTYVYTMYTYVYTCDTKILYSRATATVFSVYLYACMHAHTHTHTHSSRQNCLIGHTGTCKHVCT
jgi:hypothetical protein